MRNIWYIKKLCHFLQMLFQTARNPELKPNNLVTVLGSTFPSSGINVTLHDIHNFEPAFRKRSIISRTQINAICPNHCFCVLINKHEQQMRTHSARLWNYYDKCKCNWFQSEATRRQTVGLNHVNSFRSSTVFLSGIYRVFISRFCCSWSEFMNIFVMGYKVKLSCK